MGFYDALQMIGEWHSLANGWAALTIYSFATNKSS
jgi:hypothetical protein